MSEPKFDHTEAAFVQWVKDTVKPDPLVEEFRKLIGAERGWATVMSEPLRGEFQRVRMGEKGLEELIDWIESEKAEGRLHLIQLRPD